MSTENVEVFNRYYGNGVATQFSIGFPYLKREFVKVYLYKKDTDEEKVLNSDQFSFVNDSIIQYPVLSTDEVLKEGDIITIQRETELGSEFEFDNQRRLFPVEVMNADDLAFQQIQELSREIKRAVRVNPTAAQTPEELLQTVYDKLDSATEIAGDAISAANQAQIAADNATAAVNSAEQTLANVTAYVDSAKVDIDSTVAQAKADVNTAIDEATMDISNIVSDAEGSITNIAVTEANKAIANAAEQATDMATANLNSYVDGTVKPSLQAYVDQAQEDANSAATSMEQAALSATAASNYASNASADADNAAESAGLAANSAAAAKVSENNAKASETNAEAKKAEIEAIAELASFGNIGDIKYTSRTDVPNGGAWCDGAEYTKAQFPDVYQMLVDGKLQSTTVSEFDSTVSANGSCGLFGLDTANERFKVPLLKDVYLKAGQAGEMFGAESLLNITGNFSSVTDKKEQGGAISEIGRSRWPSGNNYFDNDVLYAFNASRSSSTYQDGAKVNPDHVTYRAYVVLYSKVLDVPASVDKAIIWAEGTDAQVQALGGTKSAKGWAESVRTTITYWE